jgi:ribosomal protein S18 acetylase RimI-like enzyme
MSITNINVDTCNFSDSDDLKALAALINEYIVDDMGGGEKLSPIQQLRLVSGLDEHPKSIVILAKADEVYVGMIVAFENFSTFSVKPMINIHDVIVRKEYRGLGVGRKLMHKIEEIARERSCSRITLEVRHDNVIAQELYKSMGFAETEPPMYFWRKYL